MTERATETIETHLGDGLYASYDGWQITLRAPREYSSHWVALEPQTMEAFIKFAERVGMLKPRTPPAEDVNT